MLTRDLPRPTEIAPVRPGPDPGSPRLGAPPHPRPGAHRHRETMGSAVTDLRAMIMLTNAPAGPTPRRSRRSPGRLARTAAAGLLMVLGAALSGCAGQAAASSPRMELATAYVGQPQGSDITDAYLVIRNTGNADRLISATTSVGGTVTLRGPVGGQTTAMRTVSFIPMPGHALVRLDPNGFHLVISGARPMKSGTNITLTLRFAHAGIFRVPAEVTNPQTGGSSYFLN
jgi:periplasmic copper chaperone A